MAGKIDKETLKQEIKEDLLQYAHEEVIFVHADASEVDRVAGEVLSRHRETIKELADR